ncbi:ACT domain-containing protein [Gallaecimonas sp. GXIMD4217]|uniref:glycine cleavage system protein R n=1 Tax=Gallaecimonas sp. GXIMD4217 TaxID=3131927 RepID=UPI00311B18D4
MSKYLVVTAIGEDRPGIVHEVIQLVSQCQCNIVDSRTVIFGQEFTMMMLVSGDWNAIGQIESQLPLLARDHKLLTMIKRTGAHAPDDYGDLVEMTLETDDRPGIISQVTRFLAEHKVNLGALSSSVTPGEQGERLHVTLRINLPQGLSVDDLEGQLTPFGQAERLNLTLSRLTQHSEIRHEES